MEDWKEIRLGDYVQFQNGYAFKSSDFKSDGKYKIIKIKELKDGLVKFFDDTANVDCENTSIINKYKVEKNDVLFALTGDPVSKPNPLSWVGRVSINRNDDKALLNQRTCKILKSNKIDNIFLYYYFRQWENFFSLASKATGSASQANISTSTIGDTVINLPPLPTQQKIAQILSSLEDKIELNNKINANLEQQAQALFKNWFVDFEPFGGEMPAGWRNTTLDSFCNIFTGRKNANASVENGQYKFFTCSPNPLPIDSFIFDGDAIIVSGNGAYTGRTRFYSGKFDLYQRTYACTMKEDINPEYVYLLYWIVKFVLSKKIMGGTHGSAIPYIVMDDIAKFEIRYDEKTFEELSKIMKSIVLQIQDNENQNEKLATLRDTLLPKLMSGELEVN